MSATRRLALMPGLILLLATGGLLAAQSPNDIIEEAVGLLEEGLDGRRDEFAIDSTELYLLIDDILMPRFDRRGAAQLVLAVHWKTASDDQKQRFIDAFYNSLLRRYADGVLEFKQDQVEILPFRGDATKRRVTVRTIVRLNDGTKVPVHYSLVNRNDVWLMFDVMVEGISYVRNYRAELDSEIRATNLDSVIERLEEEVSRSNGDE